MSTPTPVLDRLPLRPDDLFTIEDLASALGVHRDAVWRAVTSGTIPGPHARRGRGQGGQIFLSREQIAAALHANRLPRPRPRPPKESQ